MVAWMKKNGWPPPQSKWPNTLAGAMSAAASASAAYEKPAVAGSDIHQAMIQQVWKGLGGNATGTDSADPGWSWVGERGPELMLMRGGEKVVSARESAAAVGVAEVPWHNGMTRENAQSGSAGSAFHFNFDKGAVQFTNTAGFASNSDEKDALQRFATYVKEEMKDEAVELAIARGEKHG